jgi:hypothetical protein
MNFFKHYFKEMEDLDNCIHDDIVEGVCDNCGLMVGEGYDFSTEYSKNYTKMNTTKVSILESIEGLPEEVINVARSNIEKKQEENGKKIRNDAKNTFIVLYNAYLELGLDFKPHELAEKLKLNRKDINWCLKVSSGTSLTKTSVSEDNRYPSIVIISPVSFIESICKNNEISQYCDEIKDITREILEKKDILYSSRPEYVSYAIVKKYAEKNGISLKSFSKKNKISDNALKRTINDIDFFFQ